MTEIPISPEIWKLAGEILTEKQLTVLELRERHGFSWNQLAVNFNCTRANVREIHRAATKNVYDELERRRKEGSNGATPEEGNPPTEQPNAQPRPRSGWTDRDPAAAPADDRPDRQTVNE